MPAVAFNSVYKAYKTGRRLTWALQGASFTVPEGKTTGFIGPNGSGKTTSFKLITGVARPTRGTVEVLGGDPWSDPGVRGMIGFLPERPVYPSNITVEKLVATYARIKGGTPREALRIAKTMGLAGHLDKQVSGLSRGYLQRLGLTLALIGDPTLLVMDEPTANLDPNARVELLDMIKAIARDIGATVLISSHILAEVREVIDYIVIVKDGAVVDYGSIDEISARYEGRVVYIVESSDPRRLMKTLVDYDPVEGVVSWDGRVEVHVDASRRGEVEEVLESLAREGLVTSYTIKASDLYEVYRRAVG